MRRINFTLDDATIELLEQLAETYYNGNRSLTVRSALESLAAHTGHAGWVIAGYTPVVLADQANCHSCGHVYSSGEVLYRPVFERGRGPTVLAKLPAESWLDCAACVENYLN
jgi:hypothetical protein